MWLRHCLLDLRGHATIMIVSRPSPQAARGLSLLLLVAAASAAKECAVPAAPSDGTGWQVAAACDPADMSLGDCCAPTCGFGFAPVSVAACAVACTCVRTEKQLNSEFSLGHTHRPQIRIEGGIRAVENRSLRERFESFIVSL